MKLTYVELVALIIVAIVTGWFCYFFWKQTYVFDHGSLQPAVISRFPERCGRNPHMDVRLAEKEYRKVMLQNHECRNGDFRVGDTVQIRVHSKFDDIALRNYEKPAKRLYLTIGLYLLGMTAVWWNVRRRKADPRH